MTQYTIHHDDELVYTGSYNPKVFAAKFPYPVSFPIEPPGLTHLPDGWMLTPCPLPDPSPTPDPVPQQPIEDHIAQVQDTINSAAAQARSLCVPLGMEQIYLRKETEARGYLEDPTFPTPLLQAEATATNRTLTQLVDLVIEKADAWHAKELEIEVKRRQLRCTAATLTTHDDLDALSQTLWG